MGRLATAAALIAILGALTALPSYAKPPSTGPLAVSVTSGPSNPTTSTDATFGFTIGGAPTSTECRESAGVGDRFTRSGALGSAEAGGPWNASAAFSTDGQRAHAVAASATTRIATLGTSLGDADIAVRVSLTAVPAGAQAGALVAARVSGADHFGARLVVQPGGQVRLQLARSWLGIETVLGSVGVGSKYKAGQVFWLRLQTLGSSVQAKTWADGKAEPASWQISVVDLTPLVGGSVGFGAHAGTGLSNSVEIVTDDFSATDPSAAGSIASCPGGTASYSGLALGGHVFRVRASAASNQVTAIYPWTINPPAPTVTVTSGPPTNTTSRSAEFTVEVGGQPDAVSCALNGSPYPGGGGNCLASDGSVALSAVAVGDHTFEVTATNVSGSASDSWDWQVFPKLSPFLIAVTPTVATSVDEPAVVVSFASEDDPSLSVSVDCDVDTYSYPVPYDTLPKDAAEIANGCVTPYAVNETGDCSAYTIGDLPPGTVTPDPAPNCMRSKNGSVSSVRKGVAVRLGPEDDITCAPNNWSLFPNFPADDPRIMNIVVTSATFSGSGSSILPVLGVARFYVTGFDISAQRPACPGEDPHPTLGSSYTQSLDDGQIWGHFIP